MSGRILTLASQPNLCRCAATLVIAWALMLRGEVAAEELTMPAADQSPIKISADFSQEWMQGRSRVLLLRGRCQIEHAPSRIQAEKLVVWQRSFGGRTQLHVYAEEQVRVDRPGRSFTESTLFVELTTQADVTLQVAHRLTDSAAENDSLYQRAVKRRQATQQVKVQQTQLLLPAEPPGPEFPDMRIEPAQTDVRRIRTFPRSAVPFNVLSFKSEDTTPPEQILVLTGGVNLIIDGVVGGVSVDLAADRVVIWTVASDEEEFSPEFLQSQDTPFQIYLEGNIVIRQGLTTTRAARAFYDAREKRAMIVDAELRAELPDHGGVFRIRAERLRQLARDSFHAQNTWLTTSRMGKPGYRIQASDVFLDYRAVPDWLGGGDTEVDPVTGVTKEREIAWITTMNNAFFLDDYPLMFAPYLSSPAEDPKIPLRQIAVAYDDVFGVQLKTGWSISQLFGMEIPQSVEWNGLFDIYSDRGPAAGSTINYDVQNFLGIPGATRGKGLIYHVHDDGTDNLGLDRRSLEPESHERWVASLQHRQHLPFSSTFEAEVGVVSDRNFWEQYYEEEFDTEKDLETLVSLKQQSDNWQAKLWARPQINDFETNTQWAPRGDLYVLGEPVFNSPLTWSMHSSAGYAHLHPADAPTDPADTFSPLPYVTDAEGLVAMTRHELNLPFWLGPINVTPFALGEAAYWGDDFSGNEIDRLVGSVGIRSSLAMSRAFPEVCSDIFNLHGLAHKMLFEVEYSLTESNLNLSDIPQFNEFDENAQERFRYRLLTNTFSGALPPFFEPRFYAVRNGVGRGVADPYHELIDDQQVVRFRWRNRLQTKVGPPERRRIKDWMTLDLEAALFPNPDEDNFGEEIGLLGARYAWHLSDRTSFLANAQYDLFDNAPEIWNVALLSQRSQRGSVYVGYRQVKGASLDSQILTASFSYRMSPKWVTSFGTAYDVAEENDLGQSLTITRIGGDFLIHLGAHYDSSKGNAGVAISIEPRWGSLHESSTQLSSLLGIR